MNKNIKRIRRQLRIRSKIKKQEARSRISVFRSNRFLYAQVVDSKGATIIGVSEKNLEKLSNEKPIERARRLGKLLANKCQEKKIAKAVFDKGGYLYHGRVKALAEGAREGGLEF